MYGQKGYSPRQWEQNIICSIQLLYDLTIPLIRHSPLALVPGTETELTSGSLLPTATDTAGSFHDTLRLAVVVGRAAAGGRGRVIRLELSHRLDGTVAAWGREEGGRDTRSAAEVMMPELPWEPVRRCVRAAEWEFGWYSEIWMNVWCLLKRQLWTAFQLLSL